MEKKIEIPEGYEARIDGNKVVLVQKESEDDRIRKEMIAFLKSEKAFQTIDLPKSERWITYLERQKEQKPKRERKKPKGSWLSKSKYELAHEEELLIKRQKELSEIRALKNKDQKPAVWSEEDETYLEDVLWCIEKAEKVAKDEGDMGACWSARRWLKSLPERFNLQPKQEWNAEDYHWEGLVQWLRDYQKTIDRNSNNMAYEDIEYYIGWVESIRHSWKLSEEQQKQKKECNNCPHCVDRKDQNGWHFKGCFGGPYKGKFIAEIDECPLQEQPKEICHKCIYHGKDDGYCYNPHGGMQSCINENGVYDCTGFCETEQEQPEVDLEKTVEFECIGKKVKMTVQELINYYIDTECVDVAEECGF